MVVHVQVGKQLTDDAGTQDPLLALISTSRYATPLVLSTQCAHNFIVFEVGLEAILEDCHLPCFSDQTPRLLFLESPRISMASTVRTGYTATEEFAQLGRHSTSLQCDD